MRFSRWATCAASGPLGFEHPGVFGFEADRMFRVSAGSLERLEGQIPLPISGTAQLGERLCLLPAFPLEMSCRDETGAFRTRPLPHLPPGYDVGDVGICFEWSCSTRMASFAPIPSPTKPGAKPFPSRR